MASRGLPLTGAAGTHATYQLPKHSLQEPPHTIFTRVAMNAPPQGTLIPVLNNYSNLGIDITIEKELRSANLTIFQSIQKA